MYRKNVAGQFVYFQGEDASSHGIKSGVTWTVRRCIDGTFAAGGGTVTEDGTTGWYKYALAQADVNGKNIGINFTGTGAVPVTVNLETDYLPEEYSTLHTAPTLPQLLYELRAMGAEKSVSGTTVTTKKIDGSTTAETFTLNSATLPTSITRAS